MKKIISLFIASLFVLQANAQYAAQAQSADDVAPGLAGVKLAQGFTCQDPYLQDANLTIQKRMRYAQSSLQTIEQILPDLQKDAKNSANWNQVSKLLFFSSVSALLSWGVALHVGLRAGGGLINLLKARQYMQWTTYYYKSTGIPWAFAAYESKILLPATLSVLPALTSSIGALQTLDLMSPTESDRKAFAKMKEDLVFKPTKEESVRLGLGLTPGDINQMIVDFQEEFIDRTQADLDVKNEKLMKANRVESTGTFNNGIFGGDGADYANALLITQSAKRDLYKFHINLLEDQQRQLARICAHEVKQ